jgi:hypothetical protein
MVILSTMLFRAGSKIRVQIEEACFQQDAASCSAISSAASPHPFHFSFSSASKKLAWYLATPI